MKAIFVSIITILFISISCADLKTERKSRLQGSLDSLLAQLNAENKFDGTVVVGTNRMVLYERAIGTANRVWDLPMKLEHRFDICSVNKSFIATLVLIAVEEERLSLNELLVDRLKEFNYSGVFSPEITIHQMLTHTSGLPDYEQVAPALYENHALRLKRKHFTHQEYVDFISRLPSKGKAGAQFYYSNFAYHLLTIILEDLYERPFSELLDRKICQPLGLRHTFSTVSNTKIFENLVEGYNYNEIEDSWSRNQFIDLTLGRRIFSTSHDLYLWGREMSAPSLLGEEGERLMKTNHLKNINADVSYGYGWVVFDGDGRYVMGDLGIDKQYLIHGGATEGYKSMLINIENGQYIISFLSNTGNQTDEMELSKSIIDILINSKDEK